MAGFARQRPERAFASAKERLTLPLIGRRGSKVTTTPDAAEALRQARAWLTQKGSGPRGKARWIALRNSRRLLRTYPYLGTAVVDHPGRYRLVSSGYRLIYTIDPDTGESGSAGHILIIAVFGPGQP